MRIAPQLLSACCIAGAFASLAAPGCGDDESTDGGPPNPNRCAATGQGGEDVVQLGPEAGFLEVPPGTLAGHMYPARMFYSFQPALDDSSTTPLLLFFNGGPGSATSGILMVYGTGPLTLDAESPVDTPLAPNPATYTRFANLLYIDEQQAGLSYGIGPLGECNSGWDGAIEDAGDYVHALLDFLDAHPSLRRRPIVLVGESYGGTRAVMMLYLLQHYAVAADPPPTLLPASESETVYDRLPWLRERAGSFRCARSFLRRHGAHAGPGGAAVRPDDPDSTGPLLARLDFRCATAAG